MNLAVWKLALVNSLTTLIRWCWLFAGLSWSSGVLSTK